MGGYVRNDVCCYTGNVHKLLFERVNVIKFVKGNIFDRSKHPRGLREEIKARIETAVGSGNMANFETQGNFFITIDLPMAEELRNLSSTPSWAVSQDSAIKLHDQTLVH